MNDPYADIEDTQSYRISRKACVRVTAVLMLFVLIPPIWRNVNSVRDPDQWAPVTGLYHWDSGTPLRRHLREVENRIDDTDFSSAPRRWLQGGLTNWLNEGSRRAIIGRDGWLYYRPAIEALTGLGPIDPEPFTVMTDPDVPKWTPAHVAIGHFAAQLAEHGVELWLVPVPVKPMIVPEYIGPGAPAAGPIRHADAGAFYQKLTDAGVHVLDLTDAFMELRNKGSEVFLRQDTHWLPETMTAAAATVADVLREQAWFGEIDAPTDWQTTLKEARGSHRGDLAGMIETTRDDTLFPLESASLQRVLQGDEVAAEDPASPIVLLGDSFVNMFDDPALGFADALDADSADGRIGAGFAQHLAHHLGRPLDVITINGQGATGVRRELARRGIENLRTKQAVVWVIAERDLMLSATPARAAQVSWDHVEFSEGTAAGTGPLIGEFQLVQRSGTVDPNAVTYTEALHSAIYRPIHLEEGEFTRTELVVYDWTFRSRVVQPAANFQPGARVRLELEPWDDQPAGVRNQQLRDDLMRFDLPVYFATSSQRVGLPATPTEAGAETGPGLWIPMLWTGALTGLWLGLLLFGIQRTVRRSELERQALAANPGAARQ